MSSLRKSTAEGELKTLLWYEGLRQTTNEAFFYLYGCEKRYLVLMGGAGSVAFLLWVFKKAGAGELFPALAANAGPSQLIEECRKEKKIIRELKPGDIAFLHFHAEAFPEQAALVEEAGDNLLITIEGDTSLNENVGGGRVMRRFRPMQALYAAVRLI